jgi:PIN domain nuclease of toxin-antitoxin system
MQVLLDTHAFLWFINDSRKLSQSARELLIHPDTEVFLSMASVWEMAIKISLGKLRLDCDVETQPSLECFLPQHMQINAISMLNLSFQHLAKVATLPWYHRDPFDCLLIAQSLIEGLSLVSIDEAFDTIGIDRLW